MVPNSEAYQRFRRRINFILLALVIYDVILSSTCLIWPETWYKLIHGAPYVDPQGLLLRTGAVWAAFSLFQLIAWKKWQVQPFWLTVIAGIRLTEIFSDWTYLYVADNLTTLGWVGLFINPPMNLFLGWFFIRAYRRVHVEFACDLNPAEGR